MSGRVTCTPEAAATFLVTASVTDAAGFAVQRTLVVTVNPDPFVTSFQLTPSAIDLGQATTVSVVFTGGTAPFAISYTGLPAGCAGLGTAFATCTARTAGSFLISVAVADLDHQSSSRSAPLIVDPLPSITSFTATASVVPLGGLTTLDLATAGGAGDDSIVYTGLPSGCLTANASTLTCVPAASGSFHVTVNVTDGLGGFATAGLNLTVVPAPPGGLAGVPFVLWGSGAIVAAAVGVALGALARRRRRPRPPDPRA